MRETERERGREQSDIERSLMPSSFVARVLSQRRCVGRTKRNAAKAGVDPVLAARA